jgi:hypothetical protein
MMPSNTVGVGATDGTATVAAVPSDCDDPLGANNALVGLAVVVSAPAAAVPLLGVAVGAAVAGVGVGVVDAVPAPVVGVDAVRVSSALGVVWVETDGSAVVPETAACSL